VALHELGIDFDTHVIDIRKGKSLSAPIPAQHTDLGWNICGTAVAPTLKPAGHTHYHRAACALLHMTCACCNSCVQKPAAVILVSLDVAATLCTCPAGDQFTEEFKKINPNSKIPALVDPDGPGAYVFDVYSFLLSITVVDQVSGAPAV
jgi:glutathione S-transferase